MDKKPKSPSEKRAEKAKQRKEWTQEEIDKAMAFPRGREAEEPRGPGRPSKYETIDLDRVEALAAGGLTKYEIAKSCGIAYDTLRTYQNEYSAFSAAMERGHTRSFEAIEDAMRKVALGYTHPEEKVFYDTQVGQVVKTETLRHYPPDVKAQHILLQKKETGSWRPKPEMELKFPEPLVIKSMNSDKPLESLGTVPPQ